jgi:Rap guanine nucleotide exchange factor 1
VEEEEEERDTSFLGSQLDLPGLGEEIVYGLVPEVGNALQHSAVQHHLQGGAGENNNKLGLASGEVRAGSVDALIVLATQTVKNDFLYQEAFLTTYRTFIKPEVLIAKLVYRFRRFSGPEGGSLRLSRAAFSLLVRVVDGLAEVDFLNKVLLEKLTNFITGLIRRGNLGLARALRSQFILKFEERRTRLLPDFDLGNLSLSTGRRLSLLNFKSVEVAEQMTLLDSQLFQRIDSAELLTWVQEQAEEKSLNLTKFTEHFNNMSYWTRTMILQQPDAKVLRSDLALYLYFKDINRPLAQCS